MHILAVTNMYPSSKYPTLGTFVEQQIKGLREIGHRVDVIYLNRMDEGMAVYKKAGLMVQREVNLTHPDLVHVMYGGIMADRVTRVPLRCPTVVSFCGSDLLGELLSGMVRKIVSGYGVLASWRAAKRASGIVVKSRNLRDALPRSVDRKRVSIIPNGVNLSRFLPADQDECRAKLGWRKDVMNILFPANQGDPRKRPELARAAVEHLKMNNVEAELHMLRGVPHHQVPDWINASDAVLLTSLHEGSPNIVKEALACNVPVVSVDVGDVAERIEGIDGCYIAEADPKDLAAKLRLVQQGLKRVDSREKILELSIERVAQRLSRFYEQVAACRQQRTLTTVS